jgi:hypothetical protein
MRFLDDLLCIEVAVLLEIWKQDPWGDEREDMRFRSICANLIACQIGSDKVPDNLMDYLGKNNQGASSVEESIAIMRKMMS